MDKLSTIIMIQVMIMNLKTQKYFNSVKNPKK